MPELRSPTGEVQEVPIEAYQAYLNRGFTPASEGEYQGQLADEAAKPEATALGGVTAGLTSLASGATLGLSDVALRGLLNKGDTEYVAQQRAAHPTLSTIGTLAGAIAPGLFTGGAATEAEGASALADVASATPTALAGRAGSAIRGAIEGEAPGVVGSVLGGAGEGAAIGALQNVGNYVSDVALGNRDATAEQFLAEVGSGAKWGGLAGGAFGAVERGMISARRLFAKADAAPELSEQLVNDHLESSASAADDAVAAARAEAQRIRNSAVATHAEAKAKIGELRLRQAEQQVETNKALEAIANEKTSAQRVAVADVPPEVAQVADASAKGAEAAEGAIGGAGDRAALETDAAHAALDAHAAAGIDSAADKATRLEQLADDLEAKGKAVRKLRANDDAMKAWREKYPEGAVYFDALGPKARKAAISDWATKFEPATEGDAAIKAYFENPMDPERTIDRVGLSPEDVPASVKQAANEAAADASHRAYLDTSAEATNVAKSGAELMARSTYAGRKAAAKATDEVYSEFAAKPQSFIDRMHETIETVGGFERANADLARELGPATPPQAADLGRQYDAAVDAVKQKSSTAAARAVDDSLATPIDQAKVPDAVDALKAHGERLAKARADLASTKTQIAEQQLKATKAKAEIGAANETLKGLPKPVGKATAPTLQKEVEQPAKPSDAPQGKIKGILGKVSTAGAMLEAARTMGIPGIPDVHSIPVIGPLLSLALKAKAVKMALGKAGTMIPETVESRVAARAAATRDKIVGAVDAALSAAPKARQVAERLAPTAAEVIMHRVFGTDAEPGKDEHDNIRDAAAARATELATASTDPQAVAQSMRQLVPTADPDLSDSLTTITQRKLAYLQAHAPPVQPPDPLGKKAPPVSTADAERFSRVIRASEHPMSLLDDLRDGTLTSDAVDAVRTIYPQLYGRIQQAVLDRAATNDAETPYRTRLRIGTLFNAPIDAGLARMPAIQASAGGARAQQTAMPSQPAGPPPPSVANPPNLSNLYQTSADRRASK